MKRRAQQVHLATEQRRIHQAPHQAHGRWVAHDAVGVAIEHHGRVRLVMIENELQHAAHVTHLVGSQRRVAIDPGEAGRLEDAIALAQRHVERLGNGQQRVPAGLRAAGLDEADVAGGKARPQRHVHLAHAAY
jgi:hypothetical protein